MVGRASGQDSCPFHWHANLISELLSDTCFRFNPASLTAVFEANRPIRLLLIGFTQIESGWDDGMKIDHLSPA